MIVDKKHDIKNNVIPPRFIRHQTVIRHKVWELCDEIRSVMVNLGMVVVGELKDIIIEWSARLTCMYQCVYCNCGKSLQQNVERTQPYCI